MIHFFSFQIYSSVTIMKADSIFWWSILVALRLGKEATFKYLSWQDPITIWRSLELTLTREVSEHYPVTDLYSHYLHLQ